jgi:hypothetical protein
MQLDHAIAKHCLEGLGIEVSQYPYDIRRNSLGWSMWISLKTNNTGGYIGYY